jgi:hypothetical protein
LLAEVERPAPWLAEQVRQQDAPSLGVDSMVIVNTAWLRLLVSFMRVLAVVRFIDPVRKIVITSSTL